MTQDDRIGTACDDGGMVDKPPEQLVEFRNYEIVPGGIDAFVEHFEDHFLESQEELGMDIVGQFRVADDAQRFVWIRRYLEPSSRGASLGRFYTGPVWKEFGPRANELMVDHTDVHLLVPHSSASAFAASHVPHNEQRGAASKQRRRWWLRSTRWTNGSACRQTWCRRWLLPSTRCRALSRSVVWSRPPCPTTSSRYRFMRTPTSRCGCCPTASRVRLRSPWQRRSVSAAICEVRTLRLVPTTRSTLR